MLTIQQKMNILKKIESGENAKTICEHYNKEIEVSSIKKHYYKRNMAD